MYTIRSWVPESEVDFARAAIIVREHGLPAKYFSTTHVYLPVDGMENWTIGDPLEGTEVLHHADA